MHQSDLYAIERIVRAKPIWHSNTLASEALNIGRNTILHAGPKFDCTEQLTAPVINSACAAIVYEGFANNFDQAYKQIRNGAIQLLAAQDYRVVVPLAGVVSSSMWLHKVVDSNNADNVVYSPFNGGGGPAMRLGLYNEQVIDHLHWINSELAGFLNSCDLSPIELIPIAAAALANADDCHGRTIEATRRLSELLRAPLSRNPEISEFFKNGPSFFLNLWMAACKCMLAAGDNIENSSLITAAGGNGHQVGIKVSGIQNRWFTANATSPAGDVGNHPANKKLGAIGDSAIVDAAGFGAMAVSYSKPQRQMFSPHLPNDYATVPKILLRQIHPMFGSLGLLTGLCARVVIETQTTPIVSLGILDKDGQAGRVGGGIYRYSLDCFADAVNSLQD